MPDCDYCDAEFDDEQSYLKHLKKEHEGELTRVDQRRVEDVDAGGFSIPTGPAILVAVIGSVFLLMIYVVFVLGSGGGAGDGPRQLGSIHEHGSIEVTINGNSLDFTRDEFMLRDDFFHFEDQTGNWHVHGRGVTLEYAMGTLGIGVNESCVSYEGRTYCDSDPGTSVTIEVNGNSVDPGSYVLDGTESATSANQGDHIRIVVSQSGSS